MPKRRTNVVAKAVRATARSELRPALSEVKEAPALASLSKPAALRGRAGEIWDTYAPELVASGMLTVRDALAFALWCHLAVGAESGKLKAGQLTQFRLLANDFGMTPSGKGRELAPGAPAKQRNRFFGD
jgi:phage terminase small subunit